jgi:hypothetical protein
MLQLHTLLVLLKHVIIANRVAGLLATRYRNELQR